MAKFFVYIAGLRGPEPQIWHDDQVDGNHKTKPTLAKHQIADWEAMRPLNELMEVYPAPIEANS